MTQTGLVKRWMLIIIACCALGMALPHACDAQQTDKTEFLKKARQSYYSLKNEGLSEFQCTITPNWQALLADLHKTQPAAAAAAVKKLSALHFSVTLPAGGNATVTHNDLPAENPEVAKGLSDIYSGMEQMTTGFFQTWSVFMISPALPEGDVDFQLDLVASGYHISYKDGDANVVTTLDRDFAISNSRITTKDFDSTFEPQFRKTARGFLLTGYHGTYQGTSPTDNTDLQVVIDYQLVDGFQVPQKLALKGTYGGSPFAVEITFGDCRATRR